MRGDYCTYSKVGDCAFAAGTSSTFTVLGTFAETTSPEHQLHWIFENCKFVRDANGLSNIVEAMKIASSKHDFLWFSSSSLGVCLI